MAEYDPAIREHYSLVAAAEGESSSSTMADKFVRDFETRIILDFLSAAVANPANKLSRPEGVIEPPKVIDVGCGNGFTLETIKKRMPALDCVGVEYNDALRAIASKRAPVIPGDIRDLSTIKLEHEMADAIICQRVIINLLDPKDQLLALKNIIALAKPGASLLFIETFQRGLDNLNSARAEFSLSPIPPAVHNLPLAERFFESPYLKADYSSVAKINALSTHFFVSRVLHEIALKATDSAFVRNSHFVNFVSNALPDGVGEYAPLQFHAFRKI